MPRSASLDRAASPAAADIQFCDFLRDQGKLDGSGHERALRAKAEAGDRLNLVLTRLGVMGERDIAQALAQFLQVPLALPNDYPEEPLLSSDLPVRFLRSARLIPTQQTGEGIRIAAVDPFDALAIRSVTLRTGKAVQIIIAVPAEFEKAFERLYGSDRADHGRSDGATLDDASEGAEADIERLRDLAKEAPVVRLVTQIIARAVEARASDIHIEPFEARLRLRYRIDGALREEEPPPLKLHAAIVSRIKIMARLNIAERRLPQDGRTKAVVRGKEIDLRVSTLPTMHGESVALRILDQGAVALEFDRLGFDEETLPRFLRTIDRPNGIVFVTGPTGSGKTTTLYTSLTHLNSIDRKIITVEDPVEYRLPGTSQIQINPKIGLTFANALRSILRQDPDIIMIGEVRDIETAQIAVQAALTGHLVLATLHTNTAAAAVTRLLDMGVEDYLVASTVNGIAAQRLVRTLCPHCKAPVEDSIGLLERLGLVVDRRNEIRVCRAVGCEGCAGTGYLGRTCLLEVLPMSDGIRQLVLTRSEALGIQRMASQEGMRTMYEDGVRKVCAGMTSLEEVIRVTRES